MSVDNLKLRKQKKQAAKAETARPPMYRVVMLNDDFTPMDFVVALLMVVFHHPKPTAERLMMQVHLQGRATVGVYPREIAEMKVALVHGASRAEGHPLRCILEPDDAPGQEDGKPKE